MSDEDNKTENAAPAAPETPSTLPETSLSLEDDVDPTPTAEAETPAPTAESPPATDNPAEAGSGLQMEAETPLETEAPAPTPTESPTEQPAAPEETAPAAVEPPPADTGLQMDTDVPSPPAETPNVEAPAAETPAPEAPPAPEPTTMTTDTAGGLEMADEPVAEVPTAPVEPETPPAETEAPAQPLESAAIAPELDTSMDDSDIAEDDFADDNDAFMNEENGDITANDAAPGKNKKMMMVGGVVLALAVAGTGGYLFLMGDDKASAPTNMAATSLSPANNATSRTETAEPPADLGFSAPPQPIANTADATPQITEEANIADELSAPDLANTGFEEFEIAETDNTDISDDFAADAVDGFETADAEDGAMGEEEDIWETQDTSSDTPISADAESTEPDAEETVAVDEPFDPLSEPPVETETGALALDDIAEPADELDVNTVEGDIGEPGDELTTADINTETAGETEATTIEEDLTDPLLDDASIDATETAVESDTSETAESGDIELPEFDPIPEDTGPEIMDTTEAPPQLGFDTVIETAETDGVASEDTTDIDEALAPQDPLQEPQGDLANVVPDLPVQKKDDSSDTNSTVANNSADATPGTGKMESEKTGSHRDQLKEVPAQEALVRPLPKKYLIMKQRSNTTEQRAKKAMRHKSPDTALGVLDKMASANPNDTELLMKRAIAAQRAGQKSTALSTYETILKKNPSDLQALTNMLGLLRREKPQLALSKLSELRELYPDNPGIAAQLAVSHGSVKNYSEALRFFDIAASLDVPNAYYPFSKGIILDRMGRGGEATTYYRKALQMYRQGHVGSQKISEAILRKRLGMHY